MHDFLREVFSPTGILFLPFAVGCMGSVTFGVVGAYVNARRISYLGTGISHTVLAGIGGAMYLRHLTGWAWATPMSGAFTAAILSALFIGCVILRSGHKADATITSVMVIGMSAGVLFLARTPGYFEPMDVLFGDILLVARGDLKTIGAINLGVVLVGVLLYNRLLAVCFDEEFARLRGINADAYFLLLLVLTALTTVVMMQIIGVVMVIALLTLPAMTAALFTRKLWQCMCLGTLLCAFCVVAGLTLSYFADLPSGPVVVVLAGVIHVLAGIAIRIARRREGALRV